MSTFRMLHAAGRPRSPATIPGRARQKHNESITEITRIPNRGHSLTIDSGWREVAQTGLDFVKRFV